MHDATGLVFSFSTHHAWPTLWYRTLSLMPLNRILNVKMLPLLGTYIVVNDQVIPLTLTSHHSESSIDATMPRFRAGYYKRRGLESKLDWGIYICISLLIDTWVRLWIRESTCHWDNWNKYLGTNPPPYYIKGWYKFNSVDDESSYAWQIFPRENKTSIFRVYYLFPMNKMLYCLSIHIITVS